MERGQGVSILTNDHNKASNLQVSDAWEPLGHETA